MRRKILIADDNPLVRVAMGEVLALAEDWEIIEAENGQDAVEKALQCRPDLIILDLVMPVKDGFAASREITQLLPRTPILMHTMYGSPPVQIEAAKTGIRKIVPKSEAAALLSAVRQVLKSDPETDVEKSGPLNSESAERRAEDRIRHLCSQITAGMEDDKLQANLAELRFALHDHIAAIGDRLRELLISPRGRSRRESDISKSRSKQPDESR